MHDSIIHYFAYGSNLHPLRLTERVSSARLVGAAEYFGQILHFHKKGVDGSGKCNLVKAGQTTAIAHGAIYQLKVEEKIALDRIEGNGFGYADEQIRIQYNSREYTCFTYVAQNSFLADNLRPYHWYKKLVTLGAEYLGFPDTYIDTIAAIESIQDSDPSRRQLNENLINRMARYQN